jgi:excisionase family DNA binding protein
VSSRAILPDSLPTDPQAGMRLRQGAKLLGVSYTTMRQLAREGIVETYRVHPLSSHRRVTREAIEAAKAKLRGRRGDAQPVIARESALGLSQLDGDEFLRSLGL